MRFTKVVQCHALYKRHILGRLWEADITHRCQVHSQVRTRGLCNRRSGKGGYQVFFPVLLSITIQILQYPHLSASLTSAIDPSLRMLHYAGITPFSSIIRRWYNRSLGLCSRSNKGFRHITPRYKKKWQLHFLFGLHKPKFASFNNKTLTFTDSNG